MRQTSPSAVGRRKRLALMLTAPVELERRGAGEAVRHLACAVQRVWAWHKRCCDREGRRVIMGRITLGA